MVFHLKGHVIALVDSECFPHLNRNHDPALRADRRPSLKLLLSLRSSRDTIVPQWELLEKVAPFKLRPTELDLKATSSCFRCLTQVTGI